MASDLEISTNFFPYRMNLRKKEPVQMYVELVNKGVNSKLLSVDMNLGRQFALDRAGLKSSVTKNIPELKVGERQRFYFDIYPRQFIDSGEQNIEFVVKEHYRNYEYVLKQHKVRTSLIVE